MDTWNEVFIDEKGVRRCRRCQHARPIQYEVPKAAIQGMTDMQKKLTETIQNLTKK